MLLGDDIKKLIVAHNRRLQQLKEQKALQGLSVDPKIPLEIQDIEAEISNLQEQLKNLEEVTVEFTISSNFSDINQEAQKEFISNVPIVRYDELNRPDISTIIAKYMQSSADIILHKGGFLSGSFRSPLQRALNAGKTFRIILCQNHLAVNHQLWFRSERHWTEENGADVIGSQIDTGLRNIDAWKKNLTEKERIRLKVRLMPYVVPEPFCVIDRNRDNGLFLMYIRNFRDHGDNAPFLIFRRSPAHNELFEFFVTEFERLWEAASPYSG